MIGAIDRKQGRRITNARRERAPNRSSLLLNAGLPALLCVVAAIVGPILGGYYLYVLTFSGIYTIVTLGNNLLLSHGGLVSLGQAAFLAVGAYVAAFAMQAGIPWYATIPIAMLAAGLLGFIVGLPALRLSGHYLALVTLAFGLAAEELIIVLQDYTGGVSGMPVTANAAPPLVNYEVVVLAIFVLLITQNALLGSRLGRALHLVRDSETAAAAAGINPAGTKLFVFTYSGALAGIAGPLLASATQYLAPSMFDLWFSVNVLVAVVLGGMNRPLGAVVGALFVGILIQASANYQGLAPIIFGVCVLLFLFAVRGATRRRLRDFAAHLMGKSA